MMCIGGEWFYFSWCFFFFFNLFLDAIIGHGWRVEQFQLFSFFQSKQFKYNVSVATIFFLMVEKAFISMAEKWNTIMVWPQSIYLNRLSRAVYYTECCPAGVLFSLGLERSWIQMPVKKVLSFSGWGPWICRWALQTLLCIFTERRKVWQAAPASIWSCQCCTKYSWWVFTDPFLKLSWTRVKVVLWWIFKFLGLFLAHSLSCQSWIYELVLISPW